MLRMATPLGAIRALWLWRGYRYGWVTPFVCLILWSSGLSLCFTHLVAFWLAYVLGMILSWGCIAVSDGILKLILQKHIFGRWEATMRFKDTWPRLANLLAVHPNKETALEILGEARRCFEFIQSTFPFVRDSFRPNPRLLCDPTKQTRDGWLPLVCTNRSLADPKYLVLGPDIEAAVLDFYFWFICARTAVKMD